MRGVGGSPPRKETGRRTEAADDGPVHVSVAVQQQRHRRRVRRPAQKSLRRPVRKGESLERG